MNRINWIKRSARLEVDIIAPRTPWPMDPPDIIAWPPPPEVIITVRAPRRGSTCTIRRFAPITARVMPYGGQIWR